MNLNLVLWVLGAFLAACVLALVLVALLHHPQLTRRKRAQHAHNYNPDVPHTTLPPHVVKPPASSSSSTSTATGAASPTSVVPAGETIESLGKATFGIGETFNSTSKVVAVMKGFAAFKDQVVDVAVHNLYIKLDTNFSVSFPGHPTTFGYQAFTDFGSLRLGFSQIQHFEVMVALGSNSVRVILDSQVNANGETFFINSNPVTITYRRTLITGDAMPLTAQIVDFTTRAFGPDNNDLSIGQRAARDQSAPIYVTANPHGHTSVTVLVHA